MVRTFCAEYAWLVWKGKGKREKVEQTSFFLFPFSFVFAGLRRPIRREIA